MTLSQCSVSNNEELDTVIQLYRRIDTIVWEYSPDDDESEEEKLLEAQGNKHKIDMWNMLGFLNQNLYHDYLNITNIMKLKRLDFRDVYGVWSPDLMLTRENIIERVMLLITAYFCMGTELRFLK